MPKSTVILAIVVAMAMGTMGASVSTSAETFSTSLRGQVATATAVVFQPNPANPVALIVTEVFVFAIQGMIHTGGAGSPESVSSAIVLVGQFEVVGDAITPQFLFLGELEDAPVSFDPSFPRLPTSAVLTASFVGLDLVSGEFTTVDVDLSWTGTGGRNHTYSVTHVVVDGLLFHSRVNGFVRETTTVTGTIDGLPTPISMDPPGGGPFPPLVLAELGFFNVGELSVSQVP